MSYLPTVNEVGGDNKTDKKESLENIVKSVRGRLDFSSFSTKIASLPQQTKIESVSKVKDTLDISLLQKLYEFIVKDSYNKTIVETYKEKKDIVEEEQEVEREEDIIQYVQKEGDDKKLETERVDEKESLLNKIFKYFKYYNTAKFITSHWKDIEKFFGIEGLSESIKKITSDMGLSNIIENIKKTIDDILKNFGLTKTEVPSVKTIEGPSSINAADPQKVLQAMNFFIGKGLTPEQSAGVVGNILQENPQMDPNKLGDHGKAKGLLQWQGKRQIGMGTTLDQQLQHVWNEMTGKSPTRDVGSERALLDLRQTTTAPESAVVVQGTEKGRGVTRAGTPMMENRIRYSQGALELFQSKNVPTETKSVKPEIKEIDNTKPLSFNSKSTQIDNTKPLSFNSKSTQIDNTKPLSFSSESTIPSVFRVPKTISYEESGESGSDSMSKNISDSVDGLASDEDLKNLNFLHPEQRGILKVMAKKLQELRGELGYDKFIITSGYRSPEYNAKIKGAAKNSYHTKRIAADIVVAPSIRVRVQFIRTASRLGFGGIGVYNSFIHLDLGKRRTWPTGIKLPQEIIDALRDHVNQKTPEQNFDVPSKIEEERGESGTNNSGEIPNKEQDNTNEGIEDIFGGILNEGMEGFKLLPKLFGITENPELLKQIEKSIVDIQMNIPKKDALLPQLGMMMSQNSTLVNNIRNVVFSNNKENIENDRPPIFSNPSMSNNYND